MILIFRQMAALARDVLAVSGRGFWWGMVLALAAAAAQGGGLLLLQPLLQVLGAPGDTLALLAPVQGLIAASGLGGILGLYLGLMVLAGLVVYAHTLQIARLHLDYVATVRRRLHDAILAMGWAAASRLRPADLTQALTSEVAQCGAAVDQWLRLLAGLVLVPVLLVAALAVSPLFTLLALVLVALVALVQAPLTRRSHDLAERQRDANRALAVEIADQLAGLRILKVLRAERRRAQAFIERMGGLHRAHLQLVRVQAAIQRGQDWLAAAVLAAAVWAGIAWIGVPLADILTLVALFTRLMQVANRVQAHARMILRLLPVHAGLERQWLACRAAAEASPADSVLSPTLTHALRLVNVGYRHDPTGPWAVQGISATIAAGSITALAGPSGVGKSTLADLIMGLTEAAEGMIWIDDQPLTGAARLAWRARVGYVPQDPFLFHDTIRANLLLAAPMADDAALWWALDQAAADFVHTLPDGLDSVVGERGLGLSGGERQRIALARALLQTPDLLVLDEATSALDDHAEARVLASLAALRGHRTVLIIAHRASSLALADQVIRLDQPREPEADTLPLAGSRAQTSAP